MPSRGGSSRGSSARYDVVIVGGGHNGLTAAAYLARGGRSVLVLEQGEHVGGAAVSAQVFPGVEAWLSRYSYLVSLLPSRIVTDLGLKVHLAKRPYASYTPRPGDAEGRGLLIRRETDRAAADLNDASFAAIGAAEDAAAFRQFYAELGRLAAGLWPTMTEPLPTRSEARRLAEASGLWAAVFEHPIGDLIESRLQDDLVRGVTLTDALIGTFTSAHDRSLAQNRCFLYHVIGGGTGDWDVPVGGMGVVTTELARAAREHGARLMTDARVTAISPDGDVRYERHGHPRTAVGATVLSGVALTVLEDLLQAGGASAPASTPGAATSMPEGSQVKVNMVVRRLPRLRDTSLDPAAAFGGTLHVNETYSALESAYRGAVRGVMPELPPCEVYCHTLTDTSILDPELAATGAHTLTVFGLHQPDRWINTANNEATRDRLQRAILDSLNSVLDEPVEDLLLTDGEGRPAIETRTTHDLQQSLGLPGGDIFHGPLSFPYADDDEELATPAQQWGVATRFPNVLICGSSSRRGGAVSGIGGHSAAMAVLQAEA